jgi:hypothetical protein
MNNYEEPCKTRALDEHVSAVSTTPTEELMTLAEFKRHLHRLTVGRITKERFSKRIFR